MEKDLYSVYDNLIFRGCFFISQGIPCGNKTCGDIRGYGGTCYDRGTPNAKCVCEAFWTGDGCSISKSNPIVIFCLYFDGIDHPKS